MKEIDVSILIPFLNEQDNIPRLLDELEEFAGTNKNIVFEVIFIDDGSKDASVALLRGSQGHNFQAKIIKLSQNFGSHAALRAGICHAIGKWVTFVYADLQDPLSIITALYEKCMHDKNEISWATRSETQSVFSWLYAKVMQKYVTPYFPKNGFDVVMFGKKVQNHLNQNIEANSSIFLQILTLGFKQTTITYQKQERKTGKSKWTFSKKIKLFVDSFVAFSYLPIRLVSYLGIAMFVIGIAFSVYLVCRKLFFNDLAQGWTMMISILLIGFGVTNISLGIIAEYLWRTLDASRKRPVFVVEECIEFIKNEKPKTL